LRPDRAVPRAPSVTPDRRGQRCPPAWSAALSRSGNICAVHEQTWLRGPARIAALLRALPDAIVAIDDTATILWANESAEAEFGYPAHELVGRHGLELIDPRDVETAASALLHTRAGGSGVKQPWQLRVVGRDGVSRWVELIPSNLLDDEAIGAVLIVVRSLDARYAALAEARSLEELYRRAFDDAPIGMALVAADGTLTRVNAALCRLLQRPVLELLGAETAALTHPDDVEVERPLVDALLAGDRRAYDLDKRFLRPDGSALWVCVGVSLVRTPDGDAERFVMHVQDITDRKESEAELARRATHDALTGLPNRALLVDRLELALAREGRRPTSVAVLFCDVNGFKGINDRLGHGAGDHVLVEVAARLQGAVRTGDTVARFGGDEFVVLCEDLAEADLDVVTERMARALGEPIRVGDDDVVVGLSVGTAMSTGAESATDLLQLADAAMYASKARAGR
jgi:diguanylate cyclase (GGDEF)-like protein/PAS domain S-box-containing protein